MDQKIEREWISILCPGEKERTWVVCEWEVLAEKGGILKRTLKQIDCRHPRLVILGGSDCHWECAGLIGKRER